jgi:hypothetical protein
MFAWQSQLTRPQPQQQERKALNFLAILNVFSSMLIQTKKSHVLKLFNFLTTHQATVSKANRFSKVAAFLANSSRLIYNQSLLNIKADK